MVLLMVMRVRPIGTDHRDDVIIDLVHHHTTTVGRRRAGQTAEQCVLLRGRHDPPIDDRFHHVVRGQREQGGGTGRRRRRHGGRRYRILPEQQVGDAARAGLNEQRLAVADVDDDVEEEEAEEDEEEGTPGPGVGEVDSSMGSPFGYTMFEDEDVSGGEVVDELAVEVASSCSSYKRLGRLGLAWKMEVEI
uniref:Uncharacterized protein n=1 Tax=Anopheles melas TaxID=34690 RepID=A0A182U198_9DIPT